MKPEDRGGDFERWLEAELKRILESAKGPSPRAVQADYYGASRAGGRLMNRMAVLMANGLAVFSAGALAVGGGAVVATTTTGSANPAVWGQQVEAIVSDQVLSNERYTGPSSPAGPGGSASKHEREERRSSPGSAPGNGDRSHEDAGSRHDGSRGQCHRPPPLSRY